MVVMLTIGVYAIVPGEISLNPVRMGDAKLLVLGIGVTLGIAVQALVLLPALRRIGFRFRWNWGIDERLREFGGLALWILGYVAVSQIGIVITTRVLTAAPPAARRSTRTRGCCSSCRTASSASRC